MSVKKISISQKDLSCEDIVKFLYKMKVPISLTENKTIICDKKSCWYENGCHIILTDQSTTKNDVKNIWEKLDGRFGLDCAHIEVDNVFKGCIYNYLVESKCPGSKK